MKYSIRIAALIILIPTLYIAYSDIVRFEQGEISKSDLASSETQPSELILTEEKSPTFAYQDILENAVVLVDPVPEYASTPKDPSKKNNKLLRVASFKSKQRAEELRDLLKKKDFVNVQMAKSTNSDWYYITVGPFSSRSMLNKAQDQLAQMNYVTQVLSVK